MKYVRLYGFQHKRTEGQFEVTWNELQHGLPKEGDAGFLLGVSENRLLLDGVALETGQAERSFAQLLNAVQKLMALCRQANGLGFQPLQRV